MSVLATADHDPLDLIDVDAGLGPVGACSFRAVRKGSLTTWGRIVADEVGGRRLNG